MMKVDYCWSQSGHHCNEVCCLGFDELDLGRKDLTCVRNADNILLEPHQFISWHDGWISGDVKYRDVSPAQFLK